LEEAGKRAQMERGEELIDKESFKVQGNGTTPLPGVLLLGLRAVRKGQNPLFITTQKPHPPNPLRDSLSGSMKKKQNAPPYTKGGQRMVRTRRKTTSMGKIPQDGWRRFWGIPMAGGGSRRKKFMGTP